MGRKTNRLRKNQRHLKNKKQDADYKKEMWIGGKKLIEENHNNKPYSAEYSIELGSRLLSILKDIYLKSLEYEDQKLKSDYTLIRFRAYRKKIQDFILHYNPGISKTEDYEILKYLLEVYWDNVKDLWKELSIHVNLE